MLGSNCANACNTCRPRAPHGTSALRSKPRLGQPTLTSGNLWRLWLWPACDRPQLASAPRAYLPFGKRDPVIIKGISGRKRTDESAILTVYLEGHHADGTKAGTAKFTTSAWVQDKLDAVALFGNGFIDAYVQMRRLHHGNTKPMRHS
ncbi:TY3B-TY3B protein [Ilyonectria robusta]